MTDRHPDDLYDALRDRLADYGQEPPAPLWAGIRAQLPPPVAAPQLRRRARRRWLAALVLLLLVGLGTWQWGRPGGPGGEQAVTPASPIVHTATTPRQPVAEGSTPNPTTAATVAKLTTRHASADALQRSAVAVNKAANGAVASNVVAGNNAAVNKLANNSLDKPAAPEAGSAIRSARGLSVAATAATRPHAIAASRVSSASSALAVSGTSATARSFRTGARMAARATGQPGSNALSASARPAGQPGLTGRTNSSMAAELPAQEEKTTASRKSLASRQHASRTVSQPAVPTTGEQHPAEILAEATQAAPQLASAAAQTTRETWPPAVLRATALLRQPSALPALLARADTLPPLPVAAIRRWAVQVLAGPALTARTLYSGRLNYAPAPAPTYSSPTNAIRNVVNTSSTEKEQAATGFGAEVQLQRQLTGRWSLGTGLGYKAFATNQTVAVRVVYGSPLASNLRPDSVGTTSVRNTYHFLTVPLRVGYQLGAGHSRLRFGLRAGADVALYLGGRSTEGSVDGSTSRNWGASGSPYRPLSLALSLGAEVRYQLAPGWELLAQPTLTHFVTSVARPSSGYVARYPLAATALVGVAWWLR